jgi:hypothetical protein
VHNGSVLSFNISDYTIFLSNTSKQHFGASSYTVYLVMSLLKVGDPKQLPATVMSGLASKFLYECSMFERLQRAGYPVIMLTKQVSISHAHAVSIIFWQLVWLFKGNCRK